MTIKLWNLTKTRSAKIISLCTTAQPGECLRLNELGLFAGQKITCLKVAPFKGPRLYQVSDSIFSLAQEVADKIIVEEI